MSNLMVLEESLEFVRIFTNEDGEKFVEARELHAAMKIATKFSDWATRNIISNFIEDEEYIRLLKTEKGDINGYGNKTTVEYTLTIDTAKQLVMLERNNPRAKEFRKYFIELEKKWNSPEFIMNRALQISKMQCERLTVKLKDKETQLLIAEKEKEVIQIHLTESTKVNDLLLHTGKLYTVTEIAKECGMKSAMQLNNFLKDNKIQFKQNNTWVAYSRYSTLGYFSIKQDILADGTVIYDRKITDAGRTFILMLVNQNKGGK